MVALGGWLFLSLVCLFVEHSVLPLTKYTFCLTLPRTSKPTKKYLFLVMLVVGIDEKGWYGND